MWYKPLEENALAVLVINNDIDTHMVCTLGAPIIFSMDAVAT